MFTSIAVNEDNIVRAGPRPPLPTRLVVEADVIVGRARTDVFVTSLVPGLASSSQAMRVRPARSGIRLSPLPVHGEGVDSTRVIVAGVLEFGITYRRSDRLVGFTTVSPPFSAFVDLPEVRFRERMQAEAEASVATALWDTPSGPTLAALVRLEIVLTSKEVIAPVALLL
ncbi:MAG: DUF3794 domain-containing protein [Betaproteobacteria bacterium]